MLRERKKIYLACGATDMRKNSSSLSAIVSESIKLNPFDDALFVFCNGQRDILKILEWDGDGFWLHTKRLEKGRFLAVLLIMVQLFIRPDRVYAFNSCLYTRGYI